MLRLVLHDKAGAFKRILTPKATNIELLWNDVSSAALTFAADVLPAPLIIGSRLHVLWDDEVVMTGRCFRRRGTRERSGEVVASFADDFQDFMNLGWPRPLHAINAQNVEARRYTGNTETVVKTAAAELSTRLGLGWTIPSSTNLGTPGQRVELRFNPLTDKLVPLLEADRLTWTKRGNFVDVTEGTTFPRVLTPRTGVLGAYVWEESAPTTTRVVVGGGGDGAAQILGAAVSSSRESTYGIIREVYKAARLAGDTTDFTPDVAEAFADGASKITVTSALQENSWFRFGKYRIGDQVALKIGDIETTEVIRRVSIAHSRETGPAPRVVPYIGVAEADLVSLLGRQVRALARASRDQRSR